MAELKAEKALTPPYLSFKTFVNFLERLESGGIPNRIDRSIMGSYSGAAQAQLITGLKYFQLISGNEGTPTDMLKKLVQAKGEAKKQLLKEIIIASYPFLFKDGSNIKGATSKELQDRFEGAGTSGETTRKSVAFFLTAAKNTGIELSPHIKKFKFTTSKASSVPKKSKGKTRNILQTDTEDQSQHTSSGASSNSAEEMWLNKFPNFDPSWPDDVKKSWFESFRELRKDFKGGSSK